MDDVTEKIGDSLPSGLAGSWVLEVSRNLWSVPVASPQPSSSWHQRPPAAQAPFLQLRSSSHSHRTNLLCLLWTKYLPLQPFIVVRRVPTLWYVGQISIHETEGEASPSKPHALTVGEGCFPKARVRILGKQRNEGWAGSCLPFML